MAATERQARQDLRDKIKLERDFLINIKKLNKKMVRETARIFGTSGQTLNAADFKDELEDLLVGQYEKVSGVFSERIRSQLPSDIAMTEEESDEVVAALLIFFASRAGDQAQIITDTNQKDIKASIAAGLQMAQDGVAEGRLVSQQEVAVLAGAALSRKLAPRAQAIATFETQTAAETAKATEADVLSFQTPNIPVGPARDIGISKTWVTQGDEKVRAAHVGADFQEQDMNTPFTVSGELLRYPGDTSLGATIGNVINCRCSSQANVDELMDFRRERLEMAA